MTDLDKLRDKIDKLLDRQHNEYTRFHERWCSIIDIDTDDIRPEAVSEAVKLRDDLKQWEAVKAAWRKRRTERDTP